MDLQIQINFKPTEDNLISNDKKYISVAEGSLKHCLLLNSENI